MENRIITQEEIRRSNRQQIYRYIFDNPRSSSPGLCGALNLSRPTVAANLSEMEEEGLIARAGLQETGQIGRRPVLYCVVSDYRIAVGLEVLHTRVNIVAVNLYGEKIGVSSPRIEYVNEPSYYKKVSQMVVSFIESLSIPSERVLGVGITMQGLVSPDGQTIIYGKILGNTGTKIDVFQEHLPYPCHFVHDAAASAFSEIHRSPDITDAVYLSLSVHLGGARISSRRIETGSHGHNATFEHIQAVPNGKRCYCGQYGCWDTLCSQSALLGDEEAETFFAAVREESTPQAEKWQEFLLHLARLIRDLHLANDTYIMLGGRLAPYFTQEDITFLYDEVRKMCPFEEEDDYILQSRLPSYHISIGAALQYIQDFLENGPEERISAQK